MVVGLITDNNETAYREEVRDLTVWCQDNNLSLNVIKTKEMIVPVPPEYSLATVILLLLFNYLFIIFVYFLLIYFFLNFLKHC